MFRKRTKWQPDKGVHATRRLADIARSISALVDEDLLDLFDIFQANPGSPLAEYAAAEMNKRKLSL